MAYWRGEQKEITDGSGTERNGPQLTVSVVSGYFSGSLPPSLTVLKSVSHLAYLTVKNRGSLSVHACAGHTPESI